MNEILRTNLDRLLGVSPLTISLPRDLLKDDLEELKNAETSSNDTEVAIQEIKKVTEGILLDTKDYYSYALKLVVGEHPALKAILAQYSLTEENFLKTYLINELSIEITNQSNVVKEYQLLDIKIQNLDKTETNISLAKEVLLTFKTFQYPISNLVEDYSGIEIKVNGGHKNWFNLEPQGTNLSVDPDLLQPIRNVINLDQIIGQREVAIFYNQKVSQLNFDFSRTNTYYIESEPTILTTSQVIKNLDNQILKIITQIKEIPNVDFSNFNLIRSHSLNNVDLTIRLTTGTSILPQTLNGGTFISGKTIVFRVNPGETSLSQHVVFHEFGHYFGLGHQPRKVKSVMNYAVYPPEIVYAKVDLYNLKKILKGQKR